jgi:4-amino-4-deoxy-L-arabinose transferase-like glycosyltransferase
MQTKSPFESRSLIWTIFILFCLFWLYALGARVLVPTDEGRYAEMAREMFTTGDWITTRLNGIKYFEKPPLQTWMTALAFEAFGLGEWQARLWTGLSGLIGIVLVAYTGLRVFNKRVGLIAGLVLASSFWWAALGHVNTLDMGLSGMMTIALCALLLGQRNNAIGNARRNWMMVCWAGMALAVLSKGLIGLVLPGAVLVLYTVIARDWAIWKRLHMGLGCVVFFAITAPWFVLVSLKNPEFAHFFFIHEHFERFTSKVHHRAGPWYYFIPLLVAGIVPWTGVLLQSLWNGRRDATQVFQPKKILLVWAGFIFVFFSISNSKLPSYILPIFPALALLIACYLENASHKMIAWSAGLIALLSAIGLGFAHQIPGLAKTAYEMPLYQEYMYWVVAGVGVSLIGSLFAAWIAPRQKEWAIVALAVSSFLFGQLITIGHDSLGRYSAGYNHVAAIKAEMTPQTTFYLVGRYEQSLPFYLQRTMTLVAHKDEMEFGIDQEPHLWMPTVDAFIQKWNADRAGGKKDIAIMHVDLYPKLQAQGVPMRLIAQDPRRVIVTNDVKELKATK